MLHDVDPRRADDLKRNANMRGRIRATWVAVWAASALPVPAAAWDFPGHRIVGAIADLVLQQHYPATQQRVSELLVKNDGGTVERRSRRGVPGLRDKGQRTVLRAPALRRRESVCRTQSAP